MSDQNNSQNNTDPYMNVPQQQGQQPQQTNNPQIVYTGGQTYTYTIPSGQWTVHPNYNGWSTYTIVSPTIPATPAEPVDEKKKAKDKDGCFCKKCKDFFPYAEPNQEDGTLVCYACRKGW